MALFLGLFTPNRSMEQTNSQILHPEQRSGTTANFQDMFFLLARKRITNDQWSIANGQ